MNFFIASYVRKDTDIWAFPIGSIIRKDIRSQELFKVTENCNCINTFQLILGLFFFFFFLRDSTMANTRNTAVYSMGFCLKRKNKIKLLESMQQDCQKYMVVLLTCNLYRWPENWDPFSDNLQKCVSSSYKRSGKTWKTAFCRPYNHTCLTQALKIN